MKRTELGLSLICIALLTMTLIFANQIEMGRERISYLERQVAALQSDPAMVEARIEPQMYDQWGSPLWELFRYEAIPYGFHVVAADSANGTSYICNRAFGYFITGALPNHVWITGRVMLHNAVQSGQSWSRIAFVMAVDHGDHKNFLELDVYDSPNSPIQPGNPGAWPDVYEYNKYQLQVGEERAFTFDIGQEYRNHYSERSYSDIVEIHLYFVLESQTADGGWSIEYSVDDMGYWEST